MPYKQVRPFNQSLGGSTPGSCLMNTRLGFGIDKKYNNAIGAWNATQRHADRNIPTGVDVPLFYTYKTDGHINVRLADGRVWSDGKIYPSLAEYERLATACKYLGWGESVNDVRVIEYVRDAFPRKVTVTVGTLNVRDQPTTSSAGKQANTADGMLHNGEVITVTAAVQGQAVNGNATWLKTVRGNWVWAGGTNY